MGEDISKMKQSVAGEDSENTKLGKKIKNNRKVVLGTLKKTPNNEYNVQVRKAMQDQAEHSLKDLKIAGFGCNDGLQHLGVNGKVVAQHIQDTLTIAGIGLLTKNINKIIKGSGYLFLYAVEDIIPKILWEKLKQNGCIVDFHGFCLIKNNTSIKEILSHVSEKALLQYKLRAFTGDKGRQFYFDILPNEGKNEYYLQTIDTEKKQLNYYLGTISHEIAHEIESILSNDHAELFNNYKQKLNNEIKKGKYITNYVEKTKELYKKSENIVFREDFAETIRLYTTTPQQLQTISPRRFDFITKHLHAYFKPQKPTIGDNVSI